MMMLNSNNFFPQESSLTPKLPVIILIIVLKMHNIVDIFIFSE